MSAFICHYAVVTSFTFGLSSMYVFQTTNLSVDLTDKNILFKTLQENTHIRLPKYFNLRRQSYLKNDMVSVLVSTPFGKVCRNPAPRNSQDKNFSSLCFTVLPRLVFLKNNAGKDESGSSNKKLATFS